MIAKLGLGFGTSGSSSKLRKATRLRILKSKPKGLEISSPYQTSFSYSRAGTHELLKRFLSKTAIVLKSLIKCKPSVRESDDLTKFISEVEYILTIPSA